MEARVYSRVVDEIAILDVAGELDLYTSPKLKAGLEQLVSSGRTRLVVNLLETTYLDSTALAILSATASELKQAGGNLTLTYNQPQIARLFIITGLGEVVAAYPSEPAALDAVQAWVSARPKT